MTNWPTWSSHFTNFLSTKLLKIKKKKNSGSFIFLLQCWYVQRLSSAQLVPMRMKLKTTSNGRTNNSSNKDEAGDDQGPDGFPITKKVMHEHKQKESTIIWQMQKKKVSPAKRIENWYFFNSFFCLKCGFFINSVFFINIQLD